MRCFWNRWLIQQHLDEGKPLSAAVRAHVEKCERCVELLKSHRRVVAELERPADIEAPFLHGRIMASVRSTERMPTRNGFSWAFAGCALAVAVALLFLTRPEKEKPVVSLNVPTFKLPAAKALPIETELENLKADTRNAARALAASFLPEKN